MRLEEGPDLGEHGAFLPVADATESFQPGGKALPRRRGRLAFGPAGQAIARPHQIAPAGKFPGHRHQAEAPRHPQHLPSGILRHYLGHEAPDACRDEVGQFGAVGHDAAQPGKADRPVVFRRRILQGQCQRRRGGLIVQRLECAQARPRVRVNVGQPYFLPGIHLPPGPRHQRGQ